MFIWKHKSWVIYSPYKDHKDIVQPLFKDIGILTFQGHHTFAVQKGLSLGFVLFVISEVFFFISIFWAFFHSSLAPTVELGAQWPPAGIEALNP